MPLVLRVESPRRKGHQLVLPVALAATQTAGGVALVDYLEEKTLHCWYCHIHIRTMLLLEAVTYYCALVSFYLLACSYKTYNRSRINNISLNCTSKRLNSIPFLFTIKTNYCWTCLHPPVDIATPLGEMLPQWRWLLLDLSPVAVVTLLQALLSLAHVLLLALGARYLWRHNV